jgi:hypothetical protein
VLAGVVVRVVIGKPVPESGAGNHRIELPTSEQAA